MACLDPQPLVRGRASNLLREKCSVVSAMLSRVIGVAAILFAALAGCARESSTVPVPVLGLQITLSASARSLSQDTDIGVTLTNSSDRNIYVPITGTYVVFERREGEKWVEPRIWFVTDGIGKSRPLKPGEELSVRLPLGYVNRRPGEYRFRFGVYQDPQLSRELLEVDRVSPSFVVTP
jgi:hypothetical protein